MTARPPTVVLAGARLNAGRVSELSTLLERHGLSVETVFADWRGPGVVEERDLRRAVVQILGSADVLYLLAAAGGVSVEMSLLAGVAHGLGKPIFISEPTEDEAIDALAAAIVPPSELGPAALGLEPRL